MKHGNELNLAIPNLPYYIDTVEGITLTQTNAIIVYIAEKHNLAGRCLKDRAVAHMLMEGLRDLAYDLFDLTYCDFPQREGGDNVHVEGEDCCLSGLQEAPRYHMLRERYLRDTLPPHLTTYERILSQPLPSGPDSGSPSARGRWLLGGDITYVDFILYEYMEQHLLVDDGCLSPFPCLQQHVQDMRALPALQKYLTSAEFKKEPIHNRYSHLYRANA